MTGRTIDRLAAVIAAATLALLALAFAAGCSGAEGQGRIEHDGASVVEVLTDTETGVQYLAWRSSGAGGITPLLDQWGFPLLADGHQRGPTVGQSMDVDEKGVVNDGR